MAFVSLRSRLAGETARPLVEGVPPFLFEPLFRWVTFGLNQSEWSSFGLDLQVAFDKRYTYEYQVNVRAGQDPGLLLDAADWKLALLDSSWGRDVEISDLRTLLERAGSAWTVNSSGSGLEKRVDETATKALESAVESASGSSAADHLRSAWAEIYGRNPDPSKAYGEAIRAVECALAPLITPKNLKATLGTMLGELRGNQLGTWRLALPDPPGAAAGDTFVHLAARLWTNQTDRHGGVSPTRPPTQAETEEAVHIAVFLVQACASGTFQQV